MSSPIIIKSAPLDIVRAYNIQNHGVIKNSNNNPYDGKVNKTVTQDKELYKSPLGTPVFSDLTFKGDTYINEFGKQVSFQDMKFIVVLMTVTQPKIIEKTTIVGRAGGTVKEYIGFDDYQIQINGILPGKNGSYPFDEVSNLKNICDAPIPIAVVSKHLQNLGIHNLVIESASFDQEPGGYSKQNFSLECISDLPLELEIQ